MNTGTSNPVKHQIVRDAITEAIRSGEFEPGRRLPGERELAGRFGVSYMTARRAVSEMVEAELLERRAGEGTYIRSHSPNRLATTALNLICPAYESSGLEEFVRIGALVAEQRDWRPRVIRLHQGDARPALRVLEDGELALVAVESLHLQGALGEAVQKAAGRAVLIGNRLDSIGVPSVVADGAQGVRLAVERLRKSGHDDIGVISNHGEEHPISRISISTWRSCYAGQSSAKKLEHRLVTVNTPRYECIARYTYSTMRRYLESKECDVSALLCFDDRMTLAALAACRDTGRSAPERMSLINSGDSALMEFAYPPVTCIAAPIERHVALAMEMLDAVVEERLPPSDRLRLVEPYLVERQSVSTRA